MKTEPARAIVIVMSDLLVLWLVKRLRGSGFESLRILVFFQNINNNRARIKTEALQQLK